MHILRSYPRLLRGRRRWRGRLRRWGRRTAAAGLVMIAAAGGGNRGAAGTRGAGSLAPVEQIVESLGARAEHALHDAAAVHLPLRQRLVL